jgi:CubicO group peptidase (beta-lactamase class C family)
MTENDKIPAVDVTPIKPKKAPGTHYKVKSPSRGGARKGAGRKKGGTNKIQYTDLLDELHKVTGMPYATLVAQEIAKAMAANDSRLVKDYLDMIGKKAIADKSETDITSNGETLQTAFNFAPATLPEWDNDSE